ncbi:hypothetical protein [Kitasatospora sp. NPDC087315]|uniref:hypothetical protein n=1 Tax=Kitasatospora sp. NPDC087315 TaxID=3364069 RepID=UPI0037F2A8D6
MTATPPPSLRERLIAALDEDTMRPRDQRQGLIEAILTIAQPELDRLTTALEVVTAQHAKAITARDKTARKAKLRTDIADAELATLRTAVRDLGGGPVQVQNLYAQLNLRTRQWTEAKAELDARDAENARLRAEILAQGDALIRSRAELASARANAFTEAADHLDRIADEVEAKVAAYYGPESGIGPGSAGMVRMDAKELRTLATARTPTS